MKARGIAAALLLSLSCAVNAEEGVMYQTLPPPIDDTRAMLITRDALLFREWKIVSSDATSVTSLMRGFEVETTLRIWLDGRTIRYSETAVSTKRPNNVSTGADARTPARWIDFLREDIGNAMRPHLGGRPMESMTLSPTERMGELRKMRDSSLISAEEYERKRAEILKGL